MRFRTEPSAQGVPQPGPRPAGSSPGELADAPAGALVGDARRALVALPLVAVLLSVLAWISSLTRSGFWADDFINLTHFNRSLGDLSSDELNKGKYVINLFWGVGTDAFGTASAIPFLLLTSAVFATGLVIWLRVGCASRWSAGDAWWIAGLFIATAAWLPIALWSSNITHSAAFLSLGIGYLAHERSVRARTLRGCLVWSVVGGAAWTFAVASNLLYAGLLVIALYCSVEQTLRIRRFGLRTVRAGAAVGLWNLLLPIVYFATIAYPATVASSVYANNGLRFVHANFRYYRAELAPGFMLSGLYVAALVLAIAAGVAAARRRDWFPAALLCAAGATAAPAFIQSQQRGVQYLAMPLLLLFSSLAAGVHPALSKSERRVKLSGSFLAVVVVMLALVFEQGANIRSYFVQTPMGASLAAFRSQVASLTPAGATICAMLNIDAPTQALFNAEMSGESGFVVAPIGAARAFLVPAGQACPIEGASTHVVVAYGPRGEFTASK